MFEAWPDVVFALGALVALCTTVYAVVAKWTSGISRDEFEDMKSEIQANRQDFELEQARMDGENKRAQERTNGQYLQIKMAVENVETRFSREFRNLKEHLTQLLEARISHHDDRRN